MSQCQEAPHNQEDCRCRLLQAATEVFMAEGFRASIDRIAAHAGVARQTIYNHFVSKEALFAEVVNGLAFSMLLPLDVAEGNFASRLLAFGALLRERALGEADLGMCRAVIAEAPRFPALAQAFFEQGPLQTQNRLAEFLSQAMDEGILRRDDPVFAAQLLVSMLTGFEHYRHLLGIDASPPFDGPTGDDRLQRIIDCFLRAYAPTTERNCP